MAMDFFQHQDAARRKTGLLVVYFSLAVILIIVSVYLAFTVALIGIETKANGELDLGSLWNPALIMWVGGITVLVVALGSITKMAALSSGGKVVAEHLGGCLIDTGTRDRKEKRVLNVVQEMAIASGTPVPPVYLIEEEAINAFAAGYSPSDAVIGVTRGCITRLSRDELQGVMAHEFSHILNGDMRISVRLIGILNGILVIGMIGFFIFRSSLYSSGRRSSGRNEGNKIPIVLLGLLLIVIGYVGVLFGKLIKSAVSRQREFLADASAVQFTRNPDGIASALKRIGGFKAGSRINHPNAEEASHLYFANGLASSFNQLLATHPPLTERIRRIDASFSGEMAPAAAAPEDEEPLAAGFAPAAAGDSVAAEPNQVVSSVGTLDAEHISYASHIIRSIPESIRETAQDAFGARAVVYALLLNRDGQTQERQLESLATHADPAVFDVTQKISSAIHDLGATLRLPLVDLCLPALRTLSPGQHKSFRANVRNLVDADANIDLFEYCMQSILLRHLDPEFGKVTPAVVRYKRFEDVSRAAVSLLSSLAYFGHDDLAAAERAFASGVSALPVTSAPPLEPLESCSLQSLDEALRVLNEASPQIKKAVLHAAVGCAASDNRVTIEEAELIRAIADALDCPIPPFLPDQPA